MSISEAAAIIQRQTGSTWAIAMAWAWQCKREAEARDDAKRRAFFEARRAALQGERWRQRVRGAELISPCRHDAKTAREGGWLIERYDCRQNGDAA